MPNLNVRHYIPMTTRLRLLAGLSLAACVASARADPAARIEVISSVEGLADAFGATAVKHDRTVTLYLGPSWRWITFGKFRSYALIVLPGPVSSANVTSMHAHLSSKSIRCMDDSPRARFEIEEEVLGNAYIRARFLGADTFVDILIPLSLVQTLASQRPNQSSRPAAGAVH